MNGKDLLLGMSFISDELVLEADSKSIKKATPWKKWLPLAACLCLIIGGATLIGALMPGMDNARQESAVFDNEIAAAGNIYGGSNTGQSTPQYSMGEQIPETQPEDTVAALTDFGIRLLQNTHFGEENTLISPLSVLYALGMTANGAQDETLAQMESALGISAGALNEWLRDYTDNLPQTDGGRLLPANAIWYRSSGFTTNDTFLKTNETYYRADIRAATFDQETLKEINGWVNDSTKGMIPSILNEISPDAVMYLVNALAFEAEWQSIYREDQVHSGTFTTESGEKQTVDFLHSQEHKYLECDNASGFIKYYKDNHYAFAALLPNEGVTVEELLASLDGAHLNSLLSTPANETVFASIPKFKAEYSVELSGVLKEMGMELPFDEAQANFTGIGTPSNNGNIYISQVIHKTFLQLDEQGTRAGAATAVAMYGTGALMEYKTVKLDRPFVYMLIDCETGLPFFIGCMMDVEA